MHEAALQKQAGIIDISGVKVFLNAQRTSNYHLLFCFSYSINSDLFPKAPVRATKA